MAKNLRFLLPWIERRPAPGLSSRDIAAAFARITAEGRPLETRLQRWAGVGATSWSATRTAINHSRRAFDRARRQAGKAIRRAMK